MRKYLATTIIIAVVTLSFMSIAAGYDVLPNRGLYEVSHERVELRGGFWGRRLKTHHEVTIGHALDCLERNGHVTNFDKAAGVFDGPLRGHHAFDSDIHKAMEGAMYSLQHRDDPKLRKRVEGILDRILAAQQKDGFLISYFIVNGLDKKWEDLRLEHQMYNAGHFFEMAVEHYRLSGNPKALDAARRFADHIDSVFGPGKRYDVGGHEEIELALVKLYCATGERRYLELSRFLLDERGHLHGTVRKPFESGPLVVPERVEGQTDAEYRRAKWHASLRWRNGRMQDHKPLVEQTEAVGHAVRAGYIYSAMADIARFMDAPEYERAVDSIWQDVVSHKMYVNGGVGTAQYGDEGFGDPYLLPNRTYCESCAGIAHVLWQHRMNLLKGQAKYADVMELVLYNGAISGISISGDGFFYQNPLESRGARRSSWIGLACCPTNLTRIIPQVGGLVYARAKNKLYVNLFASGDASLKMDDGMEVKLAQKTNYPWDGHVQLTVTAEQASDFTLCVRIPGWALGRPVPSDLYRFGDSKFAAVGLKVNGKTIDATPEEDGYVHLKRSWKAGDVVELDMPMPIRRVYAHEKVKADQGKVSLMRGPITYCIEAVDNPNVDVLSVALPREAELRAEHRDRLLGGVTVLQGKAIDDQERPFTLMAVPYYSWANREKGAMTVWLNEAPVASTALLTASSPVLAQQANHSTPLKQGGKSPIKVFILAGQSNMEGQGVVSMDDPKYYNGGKGNLVWSMKNSKSAEIMKHLKDDKGRWVVRDDVKVWFKVGSGITKGGLTIGFTGYVSSEDAKAGKGGNSHIGPELQFGHVIGNYLDEPVLLIKTAWGGKSLYKDFRPPSSGGEVGSYYTQMLAEIREALADIENLFPGRKNNEYEMAGFVWMQGWNDMCTPEAIPEYDKNMVNLVNDLRKEFKLPNLPVVVGELGNEGAKVSGNMAAFRKSQKKGAEQIDNAAFVLTHDFWRDPQMSPCPGHVHHWGANAESYFLIGNALGDGMVRLLASQNLAHIPLKSSMPSRFICGTSPISEPYPYVSTGSFCGPEVPESPDPLISYRWPNPKATDGLEIYLLKPKSVSANRTGSFDNLQSLTGNNPNVTVMGAGSIRLDFGLENAAWVEFDSPDCPGGVEMSISEYNEPGHNKTRKPVKHGNTYRLELNDELYEGVRFAWINVKSLSSQWHITGIRAVCQVKPTNYNGSFSCSDPMLTKIWYMSAYGVKASLCKDYFGAILMNRGDRMSWTGDAHPTQAAALVAFGNYDFIRQNIDNTSEQSNGIRSYSLYWVLSLLDYYNYTGDTETLDRYISNACSKLDEAYNVFGTNPNLRYYGWDERLCAGFELWFKPCPEAQNAYKMLSVRAWEDFATVMGKYGRTDLRDKYNGYASAKMADFRKNNAWYSDFSLHSAADAVTTGLLNSTEQNALFEKHFTDRVNRISISPFNQYFIIQAMARMKKYDDALSSIRDLWGGMIKYGATTTLEDFRPGWNNIIGPNEALPNNQCGIISLCHPWGAGVVKWLNEEVLGIVSTSPGFATYDVLPHLGRTLTRVSGKTPTPLGDICASFDVSSGICKVSAPSGTIGRIGIPKVEKTITSISINGNLAWDGSWHSVSGVGAASQDSDFVYFTSVQPGDYTIFVSYSGTTPAYHEPQEQYAAQFVKHDTTTSGSWGGVYGKDGYVLCNFNGKGRDKKSLPSYVTSLDYFRAFPITKDCLPDSTTWVTGTSDKRALSPDSKNSTPRNATCYSNNDNTLTVTIGIDGTRDYQVALYFVDWDKKNMRQVVEMFDAKTLNMIAPVKMVNGYSGGKYLVYSYDKSVKFRIDKIRGDIATLSGIFFDPK